MPSGIIIIDKPSGWTSHDVVAKLRGIMRERRVGHGGTLDPMATGVLPVFVGRATRAVPYLPGEKTYLARFRTGFATDTLDITGDITQRFDKTPSEEEIISVLPQFTGRIMQIPPMVSALKKDGWPLYKLARQGIEIEREPRPVFICSIEWLGCENREFMFRVRCSTGTYIRTLIDDIGRELGCGACLSFLRREHSGPYSLEDAVPIEEASPEKLMAVDTLFSDLPSHAVSAREEAALRHGGQVPASGLSEGARLRVYSQDGIFLLLGEVANAKLKSLRGFFEVT